MLPGPVVQQIYECFDLQLIFMKRGTRLRIGRSCDTCAQWAFIPVDTRFARSVKVYARLLSSLRSLIYPVLGQDLSEFSTNSSGVLAEGCPLEVQLASLDAGRLHPVPSDWWPPNADHLRPCGDGFSSAIVYMVRILSRSVSLVPALITLPLH